MRQYTIEQIEKEKVIAIIRGADADQCMKVAEALYEGGIRLMEITYNQKAPESFRTTAATIGALAKAFEGRMLIGAGTVTTEELVDMTADAGGRFIISPDCYPNVIRRTRERNMVSIPGALTPTEIMTAHRSGADFVKTSTGFSTGGATVEDVALMRKAVGTKLGVKASGGIRDYATAKAMIEAGATRIGASAGIAIVKEEQEAVK